MCCWRDGGQHSLPRSLWLRTPAGCHRTPRAPEARPPASVLAGTQPRVQSQAEKGRPARAWSRELSVGQRWSSPHPRSGFSCSSHAADGDTEAQKGGVTCPGSPGCFSFAEATSRSLFRKLPPETFKPTTGRGGGAPPAGGRGGGGGGPASPQRSAPSVCLAASAPPSFVSCSPQSPAAAGWRASVLPRH